MTGLTKKEKGFVKDYVKTDNATQAILNNYDTEDENTAGVLGHRKLRLAKIQNAIQSIADRIPDELLEKTHLEGLEAGRTVYKNNNATKQVEEVGYEPDYATRHKYLDSAYKLKGSYAPDKNINMNITMKAIDPTDPEILSSLKVIQERLENE